MSGPGQADDPESDKIPLTPAVRLLLWDFERGTLPYELACLLVLVLLLAVPPEWWGDPLWRAW
jgi:hypothetical protein